MKIGLFAVIFLLIGYKLGYLDAKHGQKIGMYLGKKTKKLFTTK